MEEQIFFDKSDVDNNKIFGILAYIGILFIVPLIAAKESLYAKFHANQGLVLFIANLILVAITRVLSAVLTLVTFGQLPTMVIWISNLLPGAVGIGVLVFMILGIVNACSGEPKRLPFIGNFNLIK